MFSHLLLRVWWRSEGQDCSCKPLLLPCPPAHQHLNLVRPNAAAPLLNRRPTARVSHGIRVDSIARALREASVHEEVHCVLPDAENIAGDNGAKPPVKLRLLLGRDPCAGRLDRPKAAGAAALLRGGGTACRATNYLPMIVTATTLRPQLILGRGIL